MDFAAWPKDDLVAYIRWLLHHYRVVDAFWFLNVEQTQGHEEACRLNELVWAKATALAARDLKARFDLSQGGLEGFAAALRLWPWTILVGYVFDLKPDELLISVPSCSPQEARLKRGLGEYDCRAMHRAEFEAFAQEIDPRIRVDCLFSPPGPHPPECFCRWRFRLAGEGAGSH